MAAALTLDDLKEVGEDGRPADAAGDDTDAGEMGEQLGMMLMIPEATRHPHVRVIARLAIEPDPEQPRTNVDAKLKRSIASRGLIQPITVRPHPERPDAWMIVDGERRWRSSEGVLDELPCIVRDDLESRPQRLITQLVANTGKPLSAIDEARAIAELLRTPGATIEAVAAQLGLARSSAGERVRLLELGAWVPLIEAGKLQVSFAVRALLPLAGCADAVHAEVADAYLQHIGDGELGRNASRTSESFEFFRSFIDERYQRRIHPLFKTKGGSYEQGAEFDVSSHDAECDCGRVRWASRWGKGQTREYCGNPDWWRPRRDAARRAKRAKKPKSESGRSGSSSRPAFVFHLPDGHGTQKLPTPWSAGKGLSWLTDSTGRWETARSVEEQAFDPRVAFRLAKPADLVLVTFPSDAPRVAIKQGCAALKEAKTKWSDLWQGRHTARSEHRRRELAKSTFPVAESVPASIEATLALLDDLSWPARREEERTGRSTYYRHWQGITLMSELAAILELPPIEVSGKKDFSFAAWGKSAGVVAARTLLRAWLIAMREGWRPQEGEDELAFIKDHAEIGSASVPFRGPSGAKAKSAPDPDELDDEDDD